MDVDIELITQIQKHADRIRNVCVLAHVDHGKTTLSDHLIASNGLIHPRLAGELRYLDSKEEEQARGITMKSSSISLLHVPGAANRPQGLSAVTREEKLASGLLINLIDSPGHVDFCSEVSTAARLSDGAFVVVDAVEGVCIQTHAVLRQAWEERVRMCLVLNKVDRLVLELQLEPQEAYERLAAIVAHVNMIVSSFASERFISEADAVLAHEDAKGAAGHLADDGKDSHDVIENEAPKEEDVEEDENVDEGEAMFSPEKGNVAFASAHDGWAFRIHQFADMYAKKMGANARVLTRALWGDYAMQPKIRRIVRIRNDQRGKLKPLFVQLALEPVWKAYAACDPGADHVMLLTKIANGLGLKDRIPDKMIAQQGARQALRAVLRSWLPLSEAVLGMAAEHLPSPRLAAPERLPRLLPPRTTALKGLQETPQLAEALDAVDSAVASCDTSGDAPMVVYVSKMVAVPAMALPRAPGEPTPSDPHEERFLAFGRVFSGTIRHGQRVYVLPSTYNPAARDSQRQEVTITALYLMMGRGLERLPEVPAGNVLALAGLETAILKAATVASTPWCRPLAPLLFQSAPIVRVAVEPAKPEQMARLVEGLKLLHRADPMVQVGVMENGEHVVCAAGEVHLETCVKDLRERFARIELLVSPPLVAFRETVARAAEETTALASLGGGGGGTTQGQQLSMGKVVEVSTAGGAVTLRVRALPLPAAMAATLDQHAEVVKHALSGQQAVPRGGGHDGDAITPAEGEREAKGDQRTKDSGREGEPAMTMTTDGVLGDTGELPRMASAAAAGETISATAAVDVNATTVAGGADLHTLKLHVLQAAVQAASDADPSSNPTDRRLEDMLHRIWMLGPKRWGPNLLLTSNVHKRSSCAGSSHPSPSAASGEDELWNVPPSQLVKVAKQTLDGRGRHLPGSTSQLAALDLSGAMEEPMSGSGQSCKDHHRHHEDACVRDGAGSSSGTHAASLEVSVPLGWPEASQRLHLLQDATSALPAQTSTRPNQERSSLLDLLAARLGAVGMNDAPLAEYLLHSIDSGVSTGFQVASGSGPLCDEPMWGVAFEISARINVTVPQTSALLSSSGLGDAPPPQVESARGHAHGNGSDAHQGGNDATTPQKHRPLASISLLEEVYGPLSGQVTSAARQAFRRAVLEAHPRIAEAAFLCEISTSAEGLGAVYAVLGRRRARILREEMREGSGLFAVHAYLPAEASFGFAEELRRRSSGAAAASLMLSHWERLGVDPFFVPVTEEEREEFGEEGQGVGAPNLAKRLIDSVRRRKGLAVEEKVVESATRQRTRARKV